MKKTLTSLTLLSATLAMNAQVMNYGFEPSDVLPGKVDTVNFYQDWIDAGGTISYQGTPALEGAYAFNLHTPEAAGTANRWERVLKFDGLQLKENTSYRVSFYAKAPSEAVVNVAMMCGDLNADMPFVAAGSGTDAYSSFNYELKGFNEGVYTRQSAVFFYPTNAKQSEIYPNFQSEGSLLDNRFLRLSFLSVGDYFVDNVVVEEANIAGATFNGDVIKVNFGYATNAAALAAATQVGTLVFDASCVSVKQNNEDVVAESVEIKNDGYMYIFLNEDYYLEDGDEVSISFNNPSDVFTYSTTLAPDSWNTANAKVLNFADEKAYYEEELSATSVAYEEAVLVSSNPADGAFELAPEISEFSFTYNKNVFATGSYAPTAVMSSTAGFSETLVVKDGSAELNPTVTFVRTGTEALAKGEYTIEVSGITNEKEVMNEYTNDVVTFEVGSVVVSTTTYTPISSYRFSDEAGTIPMGWTVNNEGEIRNSGDVCTGGPRLFAFPDGGDVNRALYLRAKFANDEGTESTEGSALYGDLEGYSLFVPEGDIQLDAMVFGWKTAGFGVRVVVMDAEGNVVAQSVGQTTKSVGGSQSVLVEADKIPVRFKSAGANYQLKVFVVSSSTNWNELMFGGFNISSYVETKGETSQSDTLMYETFANVDDNVTPAEGSGWDLYDDDNLLGKSVNGSGASSRIFKLGNTQNLVAAYYARVMDGGKFASYNAVYGAEEAGPKLTLTAAKHQFTYYAVNWKSQQILLYCELINSNDEVVMSHIDTITPNLNGDKNAKLEATKVQYNYTVPEDGDYKLKFYFTGEAMVGNISIMKVGSLAVYYKNMLQSALTEAKAEQEKASEDIFAGTTFVALTEAIAKYTNPDFHTAAEYNAAIADLEALVKAMSTRRANVATYANNLTLIETLLGELAETKYEGLDAYPTVKNLYDTYSVVSSLTLEDAELATVTANLTNNYNLLTNMVNTCVGLLTDQLAKTAALIVSLQDTLATHPTILAVGNALTDDQELEAKLKTMAAAAVYKICAEGDPFSVYDEEYGQYSTDSIDLSCFIQNANLYTTNIDKNITDVTTFAGWDMTIAAGTPSVEFGWVNWPGSVYCPINNGMLIAGWNTEVTLSQNLKSLPVGTYSYEVGTQDRGGDTDNGVLSTIKYEVGDSLAGTYVSDTVLFDVRDQGQWYALTRCLMPGISVKETAENVGEMKVSAHLLSTQSSASVDQFALYMTAKDPSFDYGAAYATLSSSFADGINNIVDTNAALMTVKYYDLNGCQISQPAGICIKISSYADGFMKVQKVVVE